MKYATLFQPAMIGRLEIKNRAVMSPMGTDFANHDGTASMRLIRYYQERARGGVGLIINEYTGVDHVESVPTNYNLRISADFHMASLEMLVDAVHAYGAHIFAQLHHGGSTSKPALSNRQSLSASDVPIAPGAPAPRPMTLEEIKNAQQKFIDAAVRCKKIGYDGVELHGAHSYLLGQFFSPYYNKRTDAYGGSFENRMRIIGEIIAGIRSACGPHFPISVRINGDEMTPHIQDTLGLEDGLLIGKYLEEQGIDVLNVSNGSGLNANANCDPYSYQPGWKKHVARAFREALHIPIIATNTIKTPAFAQSLLEEGVCDFVGLGRSQFADADFMQKAKSGREEEIRPCIGCMVCRERLLVGGHSVACAVNPRMGREHLYPGYPAQGQNRAVAVVGGGPAGMEAARVLARCGYQVTLFEKESALGGTLNLADKPPYKELITKLTLSLEAQIRAAGVKVELGVEATPETIQALQPAGVFLATGAAPIRPPLPGLDLPHVRLAEDVLRKGERLVGRVAVIGTGMTGLETAELLADYGAELTLVDMQPALGPGLFAVIRNDILSRIQRYEPEVYTGHKLVRVMPGAVRLHNGQEEIEVQADHVVLALGVAPDKQAVAAYADVCAHVIPIGDANKAGRIYEAMKAAFDAAYHFNP